MKNKINLFLVIMLSCFLGLQSQSFFHDLTDSQGNKILVRDLNVPDFFNGIHDQYALNFTNTAMAGRGHTGISVADRIGVAAQNPAALRSNVPHISIDLMVKNETNEFNQRNWYLYCRWCGCLDICNTDCQAQIHAHLLEYHERPKHPGFTPEGQRYKNHFPVSNFGIAFQPFGDNVNIGLSYNLKRSISYAYHHQHIIDETRYYVRMTNPQFSEHQFILTANKQFGSLTLGLNNNLHFLRFADYRTFGRPRSNLLFDELLYRPQFGFLFESDWRFLDEIQLGASFTPKAEKTIGTRFAKQEAVFPTNIKTGLSVNWDRHTRILFDTDITMYSETSEFFDDRVTLKFGVERDFETYVLRAGFIHSPSVFDGGKYWIPNYFERTGDAGRVNELLNVPRIGEYNSIDLQLLTFGTTMRLTRMTNLHLAFLTDLADVGVNSFMASIDFDLEAFKALRRN